jgi:putative two-component system response regulator
MLQENDAAPAPLVLVVDDDAHVRPAIGGILEVYGFRFAEAGDGEEGIRKAIDLRPDLILLDVTMPGIDGFETCRRLKGEPLTARIPVVILTALHDRASRLKGLQAGADEFLGKPADSSELVVRMKNLLKVKQYQDFLETHRRLLASEVEERTRQLREALLDTLRRLTYAAEHRDEDTYEHVRRISYYTSAVAEKLGLPAETVDVMFYASPMHDIGKVGIPDSVLLKPGRLTAEEFEVMKAHTLIGARILRASSSPYLQAGEQFALSHHERWDGSGYPAGLRGEAIPIEGRILNLIDQYDALRSARPYKPALEHARVVEIITCGDGRTLPGHFDPAVLAIFREHHDLFRQIFEDHREEQRR